MKTQLDPVPSPLPCYKKVSFLMFSSFTSLAAALILIASPFSATAQTETFDSGAAIFTPGPNAWLKSTITPTAVTHTHPATDHGLGYRMQATTLGGALPAAVGFIYRTNIYQDWYVAVDFVAWKELNQAILLIAHGNNVQPPQDSTSYIINYDVLQNGELANNRFGAQLQISVVLAGFATYQLGIGEFTLVQGGHYRLILKGVDNAGTFDITATCYDYTDLTKPLITIFGQDGLYPEGVCGIGNFSRQGAIGTTDSTFDNYYAAATDPNLDIAPAIRHPIAGTAQVVTRTPAARFTNFHPASSGITFTARTFNADNINVAATKLYLNNVDVSASLSTPAASPTVSYTTPTSPLVANTVYTGRIEVESSTGKKGTNIFWFDTFTDAFMATAPVKTIECEDYNYSNGQFQNDPPVSGYDINGTLFNGGGVGYYDLIGVEGVDFHDFDGINASYAAYRTSDTVNTEQGDFVLQDALNNPPINPWDPPLVAANTRQKYATVNAGMKEYKLAPRTRRDEWLNYTRTFANQNYNVYLRVGSFEKTEVTLETVTGDRTQPNQTTTPLGRFYIPNNFAWNNYRYVPLLAAGVPAVVNLSGTSTVRMTMRGLVDKHNRVITPNYLAFVPTGDPVTSAVVLESSATVNGTYANAVGASVNLGTKTITVPVGGASNFYRIRSDVAYNITSINVVGPNVVITYN